ncbi:hypothetical protein [Demequina sp. NBRC 110054]|uniref:hypothetical protein n=1 Tax=Demequina sp. NBRC 110054 TaxID=1570343 RepID=UPI000A00C1D2|nr:hypothetical protein [Demequina sp. NBRC 110054]
MPSKRRSSKRPYGQPHQDLDVERLAGSVGARREIGPRGEEYKVAVPRPSDRTYLCPGCSQEIDGATQHLVAWPADGLFGADAAAATRRHWHTHCWNTYGRTRG